MNEARTVGTRAVGIRHKNLILPFNARVWFNSVADMQLLSNYTNLFAVKSTVSGTLYGWGMGTSNQLAQKDCDDDIFEPTEMTGKQLEER